MKQLFEVLAACRDVHVRKVTAKLALEFSLDQPVRKETEETYKKSWTGCTWLQEDYQEYVL